MGIWDDAIRGFKTLTDYNKSETEKIKAQTKKANMRKLK